MPKRKLLDSWTDRDRLSELFDGLHRASPPEAPPEAPARPPAAEQAPPPSLFSAPPAPEPPEPPARKGINPLTLHFPPPAGSLEQRARALVAWAKDATQSSQGFIVDAYGAVIAKDADLDDVLLASVSNLADGLGRGMAHFSKAGQGALHLELAEGKVLSLIQSKWDASTVALGLIAAGELPREVADRLRVELGRLNRPRRRERD